MSSKRPYRKHGKDKTHPDFPHGKYAGYRAKCRCNSCTQANRDRANQWALINRRTDTEYGIRQAIEKRHFRKTESGRSLYRSTCATRRVRKKAAAAAISVDTSLLRVIYAKCPAGFQVDHIKPLAKGGDHVPENLQYLPKLINLAKGARLDFDTARHALRWQDIILGTFNDYPEREYGQAAGKSGDPRGD